jgi:hypothetical protein
MKYIFILIGLLSTACIVFLSGETADFTRQLTLVSIPVTLLVVSIIGVAWTEYREDKHNV